jgi:DNA-binding NarL/FixJ family response regulator
MNTQPGRSHPLKPSSPAARTRIVVVDDHEIVRECIQVLLQRQPGMVVVALAATGEQAIVVAERLKPDVMVMDLVLPGLDGTGATQRVLMLLPKTRIIVVSSSSAPEHVQGALRAGALGYVVKEGVGSDLVCAVTTVMAGNRYLSPQIAGCAIEGALSARTTTGYLWEHLTPREREVLRRTAAGTPTAQIARQLSLSPKTIDSYRSRLMRKLGLPNRSTLIRYALQHSTSAY